jgi:thiamine pyrophosphokinase
VDGRFALVFAGGPPEPVDPATLPRDADVVVAADGGLARARALGVDVDLVVGDLDSAPPDLQGLTVLRYNRNKDKTDLELALDAACEYSPDRLLVIGGASGRLDHLLGSVAVLASPAYADVEIDAVLGGARVAVIRGCRTLRGTPGDLVSLLAVHGPARGITTEGLGYLLDGEDLLPGSTRGVSNVFSAEVATVTVETGTLLAVTPQPDPAP